MENYIQRWIFDKLPIRGSSICINSSYKKIINQHQYPPLIQNLLSEALLSVCLLSSLRKQKGRLSLLFKGEGAVQMISVSSTHDGFIRGLVQFDSAAQNIKNIEKSLKNGILNLIFEPDSSEERFQTLVEMTGASIKEGLEHYFTQSEQLPTLFYFAHDQNEAKALMIQSMPEADGSQIESSWLEISTLANTLTHDELISLEPKDILHRLFAEHDIRIFEPSEISFKCTCSKQKMEQALLLSDKNELNDILKEKKYIEVSCEFCGVTYLFDQKAIDDLK